MLQRLLRVERRRVGHAVEEFDRDLLDKELMLDNIGPEIINQDNGICNGYRGPRREMINFN